MKKQWTQHENLEWCNTYFRFGRTNTKSCSKSKRGGIFGCCQSRFVFKAHFKCIFSTIECFKLTFILTSMFYREMSLKSKALYRFGSLDGLFLTKNLKFTILKVRLIFVFMKFWNLMPRITNATKLTIRLYFVSVTLSILECLVFVTIVLT